MTEDLLVPVVVAAGIVVTVVEANPLARLVVALQLIGPLFLGIIPGKPKHRTPTTSLLRPLLLAFRRILREMLLSFGRVGGQLVGP